MPSEKNEESTIKIVEIMEKDEKKDSVIVATSMSGCTVVFDAARVDGYVDEGGYIMVLFRSGSEKLLRNEVSEVQYRGVDLCTMLNRFVAATEDGMTKAVFCKNEMSDNVVLDGSQVERFNDCNDDLITVVFRSGITLTLSNELDAERYGCATLDALLLQIMRHGGYKMV